MPMTHAERSADDLALLERLEKLYVAVVADCLDSVGVRSNVLAPRVRSLYPGATVAGYALTVHLVDVDAVPADPGDWYRGELGAVDAQQPGDVMVVSTSSGSYWGELLATASRFRGARGIVGDCYARDTAALIEMRYPTFVAGALAYDSLGRIDVDAVGVPVECAGVTVHPGDLVIGDDDGVAIVPRALGEEVVQLAELKVSGENVVRDKLAPGMPAAEAFRTYGVL
jgi:4-hydroxy-4-methyl-2-oxoglutarate aldolase